MRADVVIVGLLLIIILCGVSSATSATYTCYSGTGIRMYDVNGKTWDTSHDLSTGATNSDEEVRIRCDGNVDKYDILSRFVLLFNTNSIPDDVIITSVILRIRFLAVQDPWSDGALTLVYAYPDSPPAISGSDYSRFGTAIVNETPLSAVITGAYTNLTISDPSVVNIHGFTAIGLRLLKDTEDTEPSWLSARDEFLTFYTTTMYAASLIIEYETVAPTPTPYPGDIAVNLLEKYSSAALVNQAITLTPTAGGAGETKTSLYGETLHFGVVPGMEYWFNASRSGYADYNETYTIPASPGIYNVYMERILTPIANHSYAHFSVVDQTNGGLIPNAEIRLSDGQTKLTNSAGYTWFSVNNSEQINYYVSKPSGYWPAYGAMNLTADESILVALQRYTGPTATATMPGWTPVTVPTTGTGVDPVVTLSAQLRQQNVQEGMDVWYTNLPFISQFLFLLFIIGGLGLMAGGTRRN